MLYPGLSADALGEIATRIDQIVAGHARREVAAPDERTAWVIAYPDHVRRPGSAPLGTLDAFLTEHLAPWISGVHVLPLHPASGDGGFSVVDPHAVDPAFGTWHDVDALARHHSWMADAVVNHLSASSTWFLGYLDGLPGRRGFFRTLDPATDTHAVVRARTSPLSHRFRRADGSSVDVWTTFSADQVDLDYGNPAVTVAMTEAILELVAHGAAAVRLDAIAFVWKDPETASMSLPQAHALVRLWRACIDEIAPGVTLITETNVGDAENRSYFGGPDAEASAVYRFALPPLVLHALITGDATVLGRWARAQPPVPPGCTFANILATHDGIGLRGAEGWLDAAAIGTIVDATEAAGGIVNRRATPQGSTPYELAVAWWSVVAHGHDTAAALARLHAGYALCLALPGIPLIWWNALFAIGNDTATYRRTGHARDLNRARCDADSLAAELGDAGSLPARAWAGMRALLEQRAASPAFAPHAPARVIDLDGPGAHGVIAIERGRDDTSALVVVNFAATPLRIEVPGWSQVELDPWGVHWEARSPTSAAGRVAPPC